MAQMFMDFARGAMVVLPDPTPGEPDPVLVYSLKRTRVTELRKVAKKKLSDAGLWNCEVGIAKANKDQLIEQILKSKVLEASEETPS